MPSESNSNNSRFVDPIYEGGEFYEKATGGRDAAYKVEQLRQLLELNIESISEPIVRVADIGCGTGETTFFLQQQLGNSQNVRVTVDGFDVHPHIENFEGNDAVQFISGEFVSCANKNYDLAVLFDVIEHVPDPIGFLKDVSKSARLVALHIPVEDSIFSWVRDLPRKKLSHPGHLIVLDVASALNLLTFSGLRVIDFSYSPGFRSPSGKRTLAQKLMYPIRAFLFRLSPYLVQKVLAGVSISVLASTSASIKGA